ncbi:unnamed protein product [Urochloa humidicola]
MATRSLLTRTAALRRRPGTTMPPASRHQLLLAIPSEQNGIAIRRFSHDVEYARDLLKRFKKEEEIARRMIKWSSRGLKALEWTCYFGVSVIAATFVMMGKP